MDYKKEIWRILKWATIEEAYMVLSFAKNIIRINEGNRIAAGGKTKKI